MNELFGQSQLDAGGFVALDAKCDLKATESMIARTYGAAVFGDRVVVCLTSDRLVPAEDLSMEFLGLEGRAVSEPIARQNRTALEFGHWALIHQPKHAKYALDLVKRMKAAARKAASKAGHAWDLYTEMAEELNKSVRHFLPTFWEQAARAYKELGNTTYAGRALNKALEAERVHSLEVDREHRRDAVLEFTLSGCLSGKALTDYSKDLEKQFKPSEAYETFKDLVVRRTSGGMPPVANVASDLSRLAKLAKLNVDREIESVLEAIITSPAMARAPMQFWKSVKKHVAKLAAMSPPFAVWLLVHTNPTSSYSADSSVWEWIDLLEEWGVLPYLSMPAESMPKEVEIPGGRSSWFARVACVETSPNKRVFELAEQMAEVMRKEGQPSKLQMNGYYSNIDVDILETLLDLGLEVAKPTGRMQLDFSGWFREVVDHPRRNSQLKHLLNDPRFAAQFLEQTPQFITFQGDRSKQTWGRSLAPRRSFEEAAIGHPEVRKIWWRYLEKQLVALETGGLVDFENALAALRECVGVRTAGEFPEIVTRLKEVDVCSCLHRTLVAGILDEYGWPALDAADDTMAIPTSSSYSEPRHFWCFPNLGVFDKTSIRVISPKGVSKPFDLVLTKTQDLQAIIPIGDSLAIVCRDTSVGWKSYLTWSTSPTDRHLLSDSYYSARDVVFVVAVPEAGFFYGERVVQVGDKVLPKSERNWFHDGQRFWKVEYQETYSHITGLDESSGKPPRLFEFDPVTGKEIRTSVPPFFETTMPSGSQIVWNSSYLMPAPEQTHESPLGSKNGLIGLRCVKRRDGSIESVGIDGRKWVFESTEQPPQGLSAVAMMNKPATNEHWIITSDDRILDSVTKIALGRVNVLAKYFSGTPIAIPVRFMHLLKPRCLDSSKRLRAMDVKTASNLLSAGGLAHEALKKKDDPKCPDPQRSAALDAVTKWLTMAPPRFVKGVARIARIAAEERAGLQSMLQRISPEAIEEKAAVLAAQNAFSTEMANQGFSQLELPSPTGLSIHYGPRSVASQLMEIGDFFRGKTIGQFPSIDRYWFPLLLDLPGVAWRSFWKQATNEKTASEIQERLKGPWIDSFKCIAATGLLDLPGKFCLYKSNLSEMDTSNSDSPINGLREFKCVAFDEGQSRYVACPFHAYPSQAVFTLEYSPSGKVKPPKAYPIESSEAFVPHWKTKDVQLFIKAIQNVKTLPLPAPEKLVDSAAKLGLHPISLAMVWMGELRTSLYGQEKLTKELREFYDWKVKDIQAALTELASIEVPKKLITECLTAPSFVFSNPATTFGRMVASWSELRSNIPQLPQEVTTAFARAISGYNALPIKLFTELMTVHAKSEIFQQRKCLVKTPTRTNSYHVLEVEYDPPMSWRPEAVFPYLIKALAIVNYYLTTGHSFRRQIPVVIDAIRGFLNDPNTMLASGQRYLLDSSGSFNAEASIAALSALVGKLEKDDKGVFRCDTGSLVVATIPPQAFFFVRPSILKSDLDFAKVHAATSHSTNDDDVNTGQNDIARFVQQIRSDGVSRLADCNRHSQLAEGKWEQNPLNSAAELVAQCAKKLKISELAATLYLEVLTLHDPTTANIKNWNEWSSKQVQQASEELVKAGHLIEAKRERAGREVFLPGGWEPLKLPNLPIESWKLPMFGFQSTDRLRGGSAEMIVCEESIAGLFETAWGRIQSGDVPVYQDAPAKPKRKK